MAIAEPNMMPFSMRRLLQPRRSQVHEASSGMVLFLFFFLSIGKGRKLLILLDHGSFRIRSVKKYRVENKNHI